MAFIEVAGLHKAYKTAAGDLPVLSDLELTVSSGEMVAIIGASGVGKSTLLHVLGGLDVFDCRLGAHRGRGHRPPGRRGPGAVPEPAGWIRLPVPPPIARVHCARKRRNAARIAGADGSGREAQARALLDRVGLTARALHRPGTLSGGEQQRVAVARALVARPSLLLADEPTGNLDEHTAEELHALLKEMHREHGLTSIIATHNSALASACDRVLRLEGGRLRPAGQHESPRELKPMPYNADKDRDV
jgi:lipoprotein-releasing system ATP-binding protein